MITIPPKQFAEKCVHLSTEVVLQGGMVKGRVNIMSSVSFFSCKKCNARVFYQPISRVVRLNLSIFMRTCRRLINVLRRRTATALRVGSKNSRRSHYIWTNRSPRQGSNPEHFMVEVNSHRRHVAETICQRRGFLAQSTGDERREVVQFAIVNIKYTTYNINSTIYRTCYYYTHILQIERYT